jgi:SAM-dependent methyltransferase
MSKGSSALPAGLGWSRPLGRRLRAWVQTTPGRPLRRAAARGRAWPSRVPRGVRHALDANGSAVDPLRIELGGGPAPTPGYVHVDLSPRARHLEHVAPAWRLPFAAGSVAELLAVHVLEHVHPSAVQTTLTEWRRVIRPGGFAEIHVPNAPEIFREYLAGDPARKWALIGSGLFGMYGNPKIAAGEDLDPRRHQPDHMALYDFALLEHELLRAGFDEVDDLTAMISDRHTEAWRFPISLIVRARIAPLASAQ